MRTIPKAGGKPREYPPPGEPAMVSRCCVGLGLLVAAAGCLNMGTSESSMTWNGLDITVVGFNSVSMSALGDRAEIAVTGHKIVITADAITVDDTKREATGYSTVKIAPLDGQIEVLLDDSRRLFP